MRTHAKSRSGFTLVEMLVVIAIILMLAGLVIAFMPGVSARQQAERGSVIIKTVLNQMKQNARRDGKSAGIRLINNGGFSLNPLFIQKPDDFGGGTVTGNGANVTIVGADFSNNPVAAGDSIEIGGSGLPHLITAAGGGALTLASPLPNNVPQTAQYRVMRAPRLMAGEQPISLPQDVGIDMSLSGVFQPGALTAGAAPTAFGAGADILFSPSGQVVGAFTGCDALVLWVRDVVVSTPVQAFPVLVVIYGKTGYITAHPVDPSSGDYYSFIRAAKSSGM
jgi:prepilin-type N-terminal cleavage/methylation domain-containing protein